MSDAPLAFPAPARSEPADADVLAAFEAGDPGAVDAVRRWIRGAAGPFRRYLRSELEDVEQDALVAITQNLREGRFEGRSRFATYVRRIVHYRCINRVRDRRETEPIEAHEPVEPRSTPEDRLADRHEAELALRVMARLGPACREIWSLLLEDLGYEAMSARLGVAAGTLRVRALRCRRKAIAAWEELTGETR